MELIKTWENGEKGGVVKKIIDENFKSLDSRMKQVEKIYVKEFTSSDWNSGIILIQYSEYVKQNPCIDLYRKNSNGYSTVFGGYEIKDYGIELQSDMAYDGKVVIR